MNECRINNFARTEAAKALVASQVHIPVLKVSIIPGGGYRGYVQYGNGNGAAETVADMRKRLVMLMSGLVIDNMKGSCTACTDKNAAVILAHHIRCVAGDTRTVETILSEAFDEAKRIIEANGRNIERLADALMKHGELDSRAMQQVVGGE